MDNDEEARFVGLSGHFHEDERIRALSAGGLRLYTESILWVSRNGRRLVISRNDISDFARGDLTDQELDDRIAELVTQGLWDETQPAGRTWQLVENGLWTFEPDAEPDILGGDPWPDDE